MRPTFQEYLRIFENFDNFHTNDTKFSEYEKFRIKIIDFVTPDHLYTKRISAFSEFSFHLGHTILLMLVLKGPQKDLKKGLTEAFL